MTPTEPRPQNSTFNDLSTTILHRIDDVGAKIDDLERGACAMLAYCHGANRS